MQFISYGALPFDKGCLTRPLGRLDDLRVAYTDRVTALHYVQYNAVESL
jgi:hypothetical protein